MQRRPPLSRERILRTAVEIAGDSGLDSLSMRRLAQALGVVPMALYRHVSGKEELIDGMVDLVLDEVDAPSEGTDWKRCLRERILSARRTLLRHPWAARAIESRGVPTPALLAYLDSTIGVLRAAGFSVELIHHSMHALGSRILGFNHKLFNDVAALNRQIGAITSSDNASVLPHIVELATLIPHDPGSKSPAACNEDWEFEFALDLLLDGIERVWAKSSAASQIRVS